MRLVVFGAGISVKRNGFKNIREDFPSVREIREIYGNGERGARLLTFP